MAKYPNPYNAGSPRVGIVSGRGGEWALGVKYNATEMRGMNDKCGGKKGIFLPASCLC